MTRPHIRLHVGYLPSGNRYWWIDHPSGDGRQTFAFAPRAFFGNEFSTGWAWFTHA